MSRKSVLATGAIVAVAGASVLIAALIHERPVEPSRDRAMSSTLDDDATQHRLERRIAATEAALAETRTRLEKSERQIVNFQIFVNRLVAGAAPVTTLGASPELERKTEKKLEAELARIRDEWKRKLAFELSWPDPPARDPGAAYPKRAAPAPFARGAGRSLITSALGRPDAEKSAGNERSWLNYYEQGIRVLVDATGGFESIELFGLPTSGERDINGNDGPFGNEWYRPMIWSIPEGVEIGMSGVEVVTRLGKPDSSSSDIDGRVVLWYRERDLVVYLDKDNHHRVAAFRMGGGKPVSDLSGFVR